MTRPEFLYHNGKHLIYANIKKKYTKTFAQFINEKQNKLTDFFIDLFGKKKGKHISSR